jgi:hypothetical protein
MILLMTLPGCALAPKEIDPMETMMLNECINQRRSATLFNLKKSYKLVSYECKQLFELDVGFRKIGNKNFVESRHKIYFHEQQDFDAEAWYMITEVLRKKYYPDYLEPEKEIIRTEEMMDDQIKNNNDRSIWRELEPRLLPVSPYLMSYSQLEKAKDVLSDLSYEHRDDRYSNKFGTILRVICEQQYLNDPSQRRYRY